VPPTAATPDASVGAPRSGTQSVERAIAVLECFASSDRSLGLTEIARAVGLTPSTAHRLLRALIAARYVEQDPTTEHYRLGLGVAVLGQRALEQSGYSLARPILERLSADTGESASLGIRRGTEVVVIERTSGSASLRFDHPTGAEIAMHASAMGKVLLAFSNESIDAEVARLGHLEPFTEGTITAPTEVAAELAAVAAVGYATNLEERYPGVCGVAAPVRSSIGWAHASVGVQGPSVRLTPQRLRELAPFVVAAANDVASLVVRV
jgi:IclR family acetate operon transcriptional repressor